MWCLTSVRVCVVLIFHTLSAVQVPVLVKHRETKKLYMNFDSLIFEVIMETRYMKKLNLEIPEIASSLCMAEARLKSHYENLKVRLLALNDKY